MDGGALPPQPIRGVLVPAGGVGHAGHAPRDRAEARIFYLDTDVLFKETYETRDRLAERYGFEFERYHNISLEEQARLHGDELWKSAPPTSAAPFARSGR